MKLLGCLLLLLPGLENENLPLIFVDEEKFTGAWISYGDDIDGPLTRILIASGKHFTIAAYRTKGHSFISTSGGTYEIKQGMMQVTMSYNSLNQHQVGKQYTLQAKKTDNGYKLVAKNGMVLGDWKRLDYGNEGELAGFWETAPLQRSSAERGARGIKIFSSGYFQWIAFDAGDGKIWATAGGMYQFSGDQYTEQINFYSLDKQKVGKEMRFNSRFEGAKWVYSGADMNDRIILETWVRK